MSGANTVLYDAPGPRARQRSYVFSAIFAAGLGAVAWYVYRALDAKHQLDWAKWQPFVKASTWETYLLPGLKGTLEAAAISITLALIIGVLLGAGRINPNSLVRLISGVVVEAFRSAPVLILMIFSYQIYGHYHLFKAKELALAAVVTGLTLYNGAVIAEIVRAGLRAVPKGQSEAAASLGLGHGAVLRHVLLPQAVSAMLPVLISQSVVVLKDSALGYIIGYVELLRQGRNAGAYYSAFLPSLIVVAVIYVAINALLAASASHLEQRLKRRGLAEADAGESALAATQDQPLAEQGRIG